MKRIIAHLGLAISVAGVRAPTVFSQAETTSANRLIVQQKPTLIYGGLG